MSSSAFHPATIGALYGVMAQHEQALAQWALAEQLATGTTDGETADRYAAVVGDLKRLIALAEPDPGNYVPIEDAEHNLRAHAVMGRLLRELSDFRLSNWEIDGSSHSDVRAMLHRMQGGSRAATRDIAERLGLTYGSKPFDPSNGASDYVTASGEIDGFKIEIWSILDIEQQPEIVPERDHCHADDGEGLLAELHTVHAPEHHGNDVVCSFCSERQETPVLYPCSDLRTAEAELGGADDEAAADNAHEDRFTVAQLDGTACSECGLDFAEGVAAVPTGLVIDGGQLFAHSDCLTDTTTELPGDAS